MKVPRQLRRRWHELIASHWPRQDRPSDIPITIIMPLATKDADLAAKSIPALKAHLRHPISDFIIVGQDHPDLKALAKEVSVTFMAENEVLAPYLDHPWIQKSGWLKQQFIKLAIFDHINGDTVLVHDADTVPLRDISYFKGTKPIFNLSDEYTIKFFKFPQLIWPEITRHPRSFVAHGMVMQRDVMARINASISQRYQTDLCGFILANLREDNFDALSEFEIYGNYSQNFEPGSFFTRYWYNVKAKPDQIDHLDAFIAKRRRFNSVSLHRHQLLD
jgi:hypothetical protein